VRKHLQLWDHRCSVNFRDQNGVICYAVAPIDFIATM